MSDLDLLDLPEPDFSAVGWIPDEPDPRDWTTASLFGAVRGLPREATALYRHVRRVTDQGPTNSCVGQATARAIDTRLRFLGFDLPEPSGLAAYTAGRRRHRPTSQGKLIDVGSRARDVMASIRDIGVPPESVWPLDPAKVNQDLPVDVLAEATKYLYLSWYRVATIGEGRADAVAQALAANHPVTFGTMLDDAFFDYRDGVMWVQGPQERGGHMLVLLGYTHDDRGRRVFRGLNSWGEGWGALGYFEVGDAWINSPRAGDFYAISLAP